MSSSDFPPFPSSQPLSTALPSASPLQWKHLLASHDQASQGFSSSLGHFPTENFTAHFSKSQFEASAPEWTLSLVGYSIGRRPYYEALFSVFKRAWYLKGALSLLTLDDGFFLLKFTSPKDFEMAWTGGPWFFFGKPFILQKWTPDFVPKREEFSSIPLWIKIKNLPLSCWTPEGISKVASCVGIPLAMDALTAAKTRLTFARVCVQVKCSSPLPGEISISVDGKVSPLTVLYDWKPLPCTHCLSHPNQDNPLDPTLNAHLKEANLKLSEANTNWIDWIKQRGKTNWLSSGEDDLKFLYSNINQRSNSSLIHTITLNGTTLNSPWKSIRPSLSILRRFSTKLHKPRIWLILLLYADDLLVFAKANLENANSLKDILKRFSRCTGLCVNPYKSVILFSNNCSTSHSISSILNIQQTHRPIKYLGLPIFTKNCFNETFSLSS
ncbi:hypothetical protein M5K25_027057 [Dendrobium thyrsiflorum]|uniref:DUF4283 domain-containing protein n=1 Tax=Dendrobium thyrsiflorum TaxID=117978 RepID=A0ABD0TYW5_DENTH